MRVLRFFGTLRQRFLFIFGICMALCLMLVIMVSYISMRAVEEGKLQTSMVADLTTLGNSIDESYNTVLQISQQMIRLGGIGMKYDLYLDEQMQYDWIVAYKDFMDSLRITCFGANNVLEAAYVGEGSTASYALYSLRESFDLDSFPVVLRTSEIEFHSMHLSQNGVVDKFVVSVGRPTSFSDGSTAEIYLESATDIISALEKRSALQNMEYVFLQTDDTGRVCYSSSGAFEIGDLVNLPPNQEMVVKMDTRRSQQAVGLDFTTCCLRRRVTITAKCICGRSA